MRLTRANMLFTCAAMAFVLSGCGPIASVTIGSSRPHASHGGSGHGPPPHAPAHGYRHQQAGSRGGVDLIFDSGLGVYAVVDLPNHYFWDGYYLRIQDDGSWYASIELDGGWKLRPDDRVPPGLRKKKGNRSAKGGRTGRGHSPAKRRW